MMNFPASSQNKTSWPWMPEISDFDFSMDDTTWPRISIVTPSYNQGEFIEETIRSVLSQGYPNLEYIVIDGGSTDNSVEIIKKYEPWLKYWVSEPDEGQCHAINKGFTQATGQIFAFINADDYYLPGAFASIASHYKPGTGLWAGVTMQVGLDGVLKGERIPQSLAFQDVADWQSYWFRQPGCFFSREVFEKIGGLDESLHYSLDFDLWLRILKIAPGEIVNEKLAVARNHPKMKTQNKGGLGFAEDRLVQIRNGAEDIAVKKMVQVYEKLQFYEKLFGPFLATKKYFWKRKNMLLEKMRFRK